MLIVISIFVIFLLIAIVFECERILIYLLSLSFVTIVSPTVTHLVMPTSLVVPTTLIVPLFILLLILGMIFGLGRILSGGCLRARPAMIFLVSIVFLLVVSPAVSVVRMGLARAS